MAAGSDCNNTLQLVSNSQENLDHLYNVLTCNLQSLSAIIQSTQQTESFEHNLSCPPYFFNADQQRQRLRDTSPYTNAATQSNTNPINSALEPENSCGPFMVQQSRSHIMENLGPYAPPFQPMTTLVNQTPTTSLYQIPSTPLYEVSAVPLYQTLGIPTYQQPNSSLSQTQALYQTPQRFSEETIGQRSGRGPMEMPWPHEIKYKKPNVYDMGIKQMYSRSRQRFSTTNTSLNRKSKSEIETKAVDPTDSNKKKDTKEVDSADSTRKEDTKKVDLTVSEQKEGTKEVDSADSTRKEDTKKVELTESEQKKDTKDVDSNGKKDNTEIRQEPITFSEGHSKNSDKRSNVLSLKSTKQMLSLFGIKEQSANLVVYTFIKLYSDIHSCFTSKDFPVDSAINFRLTQSIIKRFLMYQPLVKDYTAKITVWKQLKMLLDSQKPASYKLYMTGSTISGIALTNSDIDFCLMADGSFDKKRYDNYKFHLKTVKNILHNIAEIDNIKIIYEDVEPLLRFTVFTDKAINVDIRCNTFVRVVNTQLVYRYTKCDWRLQPLYSVIKQWATFKNINDPFKQTFSNYSLALLVIQFLQCGISPPSLPCLHGILKDLEDWRNVKDYSQDEIFKLWVLDWQSTNKMSLGELLVQFFKYYSEFDFSKYVISVRLGKPIQRAAYQSAKGSSKIDTKDIFIVEEPFMRSNTARLINHKSAFTRIKNAFSDASKILKSTMNLERLIE